MTTRYELPPSAAPAAINILDVLRGMGRRKLLVLGMGLLAFTGAAAVVRALKPVYATEAQVLIQNMETPFDRMRPIENQRGDAIDDRVVASQISVIKSDDLTRRVVAALGLENRPEFNPLIDGVGTAGRLKIALGFAADPRGLTPEQRALDRYTGKLSVFQLPESNVIGIKFTASDPQLAAKVANTLAETYVLWTREAQSQPTRRARDWLASQIAALRLKLAQSEETVERFRSEAGLLQGATTTLGTQEISELNTQITVARGVSLEARAKADSIRGLLLKKGSVDAATDVLASSAVQRLKEQRTEASRRLAELSVTYLSNHPKLIAVKNEIANIDRQIRAEALKVVASLDEQAGIAEQRVDSLAASLEALKSQESTSNLDDVKLKALERDVAADRALLEAMLSRYAEASSRQELSSQPGLGVIIQSAGVPSSPSFPKTGPMVLLITIGGLSFGLGLAFLAELTAAASRVNLRQDEPEERPEPVLKAAAPAPVAAPVVSAPVPVPVPVAVPVAVAVAGAVPAPAPDPVVEAPVPEAPAAAAPPEPPLQQAAPAREPAPVVIPVKPLTVWPKIIPTGDLSGITNVPEVMYAAQSMAQWVESARQKLDVRRIGLTTVGGGTADAPVAALALARAITMAGRRVVLIDMARMGAFLGGLCGVPHGPGLSDLVGGNADFTKVIARDSRSTAHVMRYGLDHSARAASLIMDRLESVLEAFSQTYDAVIVNLGEASEDTPIHLHKCQGALIMAPSARLPEAQAAAQTLVATGLSVAQHVLIGQPAMLAPALGNAEFAAANS